MIAAWVVRRWVALYTLGLPEAERADRRAEMESDLWEHTADGAGGWHAVVSRFIRGMHADLGWRLVRSRRIAVPSAKAVLAAVGWVVAVASYGFVLVAHGFAATGLVGTRFYGADWDGGGRLLFAGEGAVLGLLLLVGIVLVRLRPRIGVWVVTLGAIGTPAAYWWASFVYGPMAVVIFAAVIILARRRRVSLRTGFS